MQEPNMYEIANLILKEHGARMTRNHKSMFREFVASIANDMGYESKIEDCFLAKNVVVGDPETADIVLTAHYDTPPNLPFNFIKKQVSGVGVGLVALLGAGMFFTSQALENCSPEAIENVMKAVMYFGLIPPVSVVGSSALGLYSMGFLGGENKNNYNDNTSGVLTLIALMKYYKDLPQEQRKKMAFVFFDNEEKGLVGSLCHKAKHFKSVKDQEFVNFDCVGVGKRVNLIYAGKAMSSIVEKIADGFEAIERDGYNLNFKRSNLNSMSDNVSFSSASGNVTVLCDDFGYDIKDHIHGKSDARLVLDNISAISKMSANTLNQILGIDKNNNCLNGDVFDMTGERYVQK